VKQGLQLLSAKDSAPSGLLVFWPSPCSPRFFSQVTHGTYFLLPINLAIVPAGGLLYRSETRAVVAVVVFPRRVGMVLWVGSDPSSRAVSTLGTESHRTMGRIVFQSGGAPTYVDSPAYFFGYGVRNFPWALSVQSTFPNFSGNPAHCEYRESSQRPWLPGGIWCLLHFLDSRGSPSGLRRNRRSL